MQGQITDAPLCVTEKSEGEVQILRPIRVPADRPG